jgi:hypothetical protein
VHLWNSNEYAEYFLEVCDHRVLLDRQPFGKLVAVQKKEEAMIRSICVATLIALVAATPGTVRAEGLIVQLPKDGAWAQFEMVQVKGLVDSNSGKTLIEDRTTQATLRIASVGKATVEKKSCRWIEFKVEEPTGGSAKTTILKLLIPDEHLKKGGDPAGNIMHGGVKGGDKLIRPIEDGDNIPVRLLVAGPQEKLTKLDPKVVDCKAGKLKCDGLSGTSTWKGDSERIFHTTHELCLHKKSPFGVAWWKSETELVNKGARMTIRMTSSLLESGSDATCEFPDNN